MRKTPRLLALAAALAATATIARPVRYVVPADTIPPVLTDADGAIISGQCLPCHSLDYIVTQPRGKGSQFWRDAVTKMVNVYKAPIAPADADATAAALARKFAAD